MRGLSWSFAEPLAAQEETPALMSRFLAFLVVMATLSASAIFAGQEEYERVELRVVAPAQDGRVRIDRGSNDGLELGVMVLFFPRSGGTFGGSLVELSERSATVELFDPEATVEGGTRGQALLPRTDSQGDATGPSDSSPAGEELSDLPWKQVAEDWNPSLPLLGRTRAVQPAQRRSRVLGRLYLSADTTVSSFENRSDSFFRLGQSLTYENPFGRGGGLRIDLEQNQRMLDLGEGDSENRAELRIDRLSYYFGGDRFRSLRLEGGRFLQNGLPEFGVLDGAELSYRLDNGDSIGASLGYMPDPNDNFESGEDFQLAAYYRWVADEDERLGLTGGYQKSLHKLGSDRDLFIAKMNYLPIDDWRLNTTVWADYYGGSDERSGFDLTQLLAQAQRSWKGGSGMSVSYDHRRFPEIERHEFQPLATDELFAARNDRLALRVWRPLSAKRKLHGHIAGWDDQEKSGADASMGLEMRDLWFDGGRTDITFFGNEGRFESTLGARLSLAHDESDGGWSLSYEASKADVQGGLLSPEDDLFQHRLYGRRDWYFAQGWSLSGTADVTLWDEENAWSLGFHIERSF